MSSIQDFPGVSVVSVMQRSTRNGRMMYDVVLNNGMTASAFDASLATKAHGMIGQTVTARVEQTDKGYLNLKDIGAGVLAPAGGAQPFGGQQAAVPFGQPQQPQGGFQAAPQTPNFPNAGDEKEKRIIRGNGINAATALLGPVYAGTASEGNDDEILGRVLKFAVAFEHFIKTGADIRQAVTQAAAQVAPAEATPAAVAEAVNAVAPGAVQVGAPVEAPAEAPVAAAAEASGVPWS